MNPPIAWIATKRVARFKDKEGLRVINPDWRPFVVSVSKMEHKRGIKPDKNNYQLSQKAIQEIFTVLSSFYQYLLLEEHLTLPNEIHIFTQCLHKVFTPLYFFKMLSCYKVGLKWI